MLFLLFFSLNIESRNEDSGIKEISIYVETAIIASKPLADFLERNIVPIAHEHHYNPKRDLFSIYCMPKNNGDTTYFVKLSQGTVPRVIHYNKVKYIQTKIDDVYFYFVQNQNTKELVGCLKPTYKETLVGVVKYRPGDLPRFPILGEHEAFWILKCTKGSIKLISFNPTYHPWFEKIQEKASQTHKDSINHKRGKIINGLPKFINPHPQMQL